MTWCVVCIQYVDWVDTDNFQSQWDYEEACHKYSFVEDVDLFKGDYLFKSSYIIPLPISYHCITH